MTTFPISIPNNFFGNSFFPSTLIEWNDLDINIRNSESYATFKKNILRFIRPSENPILNYHNPSGIKLITRLRLGFSHLREHKLSHNFQDTLNPICSCGENIETTTHYLLHCSNYLNERIAFLTNVQNVEGTILDRNYSRLSEIFHFGDSSFNYTKKHKYFKFYHSIHIRYKRFNVSLTNL